MQTDQLINEIQQYIEEPQRIKEQLASEQTSDPEQTSEPEQTPEEAAEQKASAAAYRTHVMTRSASDWNSFGVSLCIPHVFANISYKRIFGVFKRLGWGFVDRVDTIQVNPKTGKAYKRAYVHFVPGRFNLRNRAAKEALNHMIEGNTVQLEYEDNKPWFWKVSISHARKPDEAPKPVQPPSVRLSGPRTDNNRRVEVEASSKVEPGNDPIHARVLAR
jgi:hypothetical protein